MVNIKISHSNVLTHLYRTKYSVYAETLSLLLMTVSIIKRNHTQRSACMYYICFALLHRSVSSYSRFSHVTD